jgi:hypothetical protein
MSRVALHDAESAGDFAQAEELQGFFVFFADADEPGDLAGGEQFGQAEPKAENGKVSCELIFVHKH